MDKEQEKWALFWCALLEPILYKQIEPEQTQAYLKTVSQTKARFPDGAHRKPALRTLRRKLERFRQGGFDALARRARSDRGKPRSATDQLIAKAIELKQEQPDRSTHVINRMLESLCGATMARSTLYRYLKQAGATRLKLGRLKKKIRKRWSRNHTHELWVGDFADGPYVRVNDDVVPTYLSVFIDCYSRYGIQARYYFRENLDVLIDSLIRALATHGAPLALYVDRAKIYMANALQAACLRLNIQLLHRPAKDPAAGGLVERFIQTIQMQLEAEVRAGDLLSLDALNGALAAWLNVDYHQTVHSQTRQTPAERYQQGLTVIRQVDIAQALESFLQTVKRTVNPTFSDVQVGKRLYRVDPKLRGDRVLVKYDPFSCLDTVQIHSPAGLYLGTGTLHERKDTVTEPPRPAPSKPRHSYTDILVGQHQQLMARQAGSIDYRNIVARKPWPFHQFAKTVAQLMGKKAGLADLSTGQLEALKKVYNQSATIDRKLLKRAFEMAPHPTVPYIIRELQYLIGKDNGNVS